MRLVLMTFVLAACSHAKPPAPPVPMAPEPWDMASGVYITKLADVMDASGNDCAKLVVGLKTLQADSTELARTLVDSHHELKDHVRDPATTERIRKHGVLFDRCEAEKTEGFADALTTTLFIVEPLKADRSDATFRDLFKPH